MEDLGLVEFFTALLNLPDFYSMGILHFKRALEFLQG